MKKLIFLLFFATNAFAQSYNWPPGPSGSGGGGSLSLGTPNGLTLVGVTNQVLSLGLSSASSNGALSSGDWNAFTNGIAGLQGVTASIVANVAALQVATSTQATQIAALQGATTTIEAQIAAIQVSTASQVAQVAALQVATATQFGQIAALQVSTATIEGQIASLQVSSATSWAAIVALQGATTTIEGQVSALQVSTATQAGQIASLQVATATQAGQIAGLQVSTATIEAQISAIQVSTSTQTAQIASLQVATATQFAQIGALQGATSSLQTQISSILAAALDGITGDVVATGPGVVGATIQANVVSNAKLAQVAANTLKGATATGNIQDLATSTVTSMLNPFVGDTGVTAAALQGLVPAPALFTGEQGYVLGANGLFGANDTQQFSSFPFNEIFTTPSSAGNQKFSGVQMIQNGASTYAVVGGGTTKTVTIYNVTDQAQPQLRGTIAISGTYNVCVGPWPYIFVPANGARTLTVLDISNVNSPRTVSTFSWAANTTSIYGCAYSNGLVFMAGQSHGLGILDVGNGVSGGTLTAPVLAFDEGTLNGAGQICNVANSCKSFGVAVDPVNSIVYSTDFSTATPWTFRQLKAYSYAGSGSPTSPVLLSNLTLPANTKPLGVSLNLGTKTAIIQDSNQNVFDVVDISISTATAYLSSLTPSLTVSTASVGHFIQGSNYAYVSSGSASVPGTIDMFDLTNRSSPVRVSSSRVNLAGVTSSVFGDIAIDPRGGYIYAADYGNGTTGAALEIFSMPQESSTIGGLIAANITLPETIASTAAIINASTQIASSITTSLELSYVHGVTSNIQAQLASAGAGGPFVAISGGTMTGALQAPSLTATGLLNGATVNVSGLTASSVVVTDGSDNLVSSSISSSVLAYLSGTTANVVASLGGVTSNLSPLNSVTGRVVGSYLNGLTANVQTQISSIASPAVLSGVTTNLSIMNGVTLAVAPYLNGLTANIQTQLNFPKIYGAGSPHVSTFTTPATSTTSTVYCYELIGAGGGGGGTNGGGAAGGGGGSGGFARDCVSGIAPGATVTLTVGSGGTAGSSAGGSGGAGGSTSIAASGITTVTVSGGNGGAGSTSVGVSVTAGGVGGAVTAGSPIFSLSGSAGGSGNAVSTGLVGGYGAASAYGSGGIGAVSNTSGSLPGTSSMSVGAGGGGAVNTTTAGYAGGGGSALVIQLTP